MKLLYKIWPIFICVNIFAQPIFDPIGAKSWSLGGCSLTENSAFSAINNISACTSNQSFQIGIYNQTRFGLKQLNSINSSLIVPTKWMHFGASVSHFGYEKYNQQHMNLGIAKKLNNNFSIGITLNYVTINIAEQENTGAFLGSFSAFYSLNKKLQLGFLIFNPTQSKYNINGYGNVPTLGRIGFKYLINKKVYLLAESNKTLQQDLVLRTGINYSIHPNFDLSLGFSNNPNYLTFGFHLKQKNYDILFASSYHQILGTTPHLGLVFHGR